MPGIMLSPFEELVLTALREAGPGVAKKPLLLAVQKLAPRGKIGFMRLDIALSTLEGAGCVYSWTDDPDTPEFGSGAVRYYRLQLRGERGLEEAAQRRGSKPVSSDFQRAARFGIVWDLVLGCQCRKRVDDENRDALKKEEHMTEATIVSPNHGYVRCVGFFGLLLAAAFLWTATIGFTGTPFTMSQGMTPLLKAELAHSKAELENILGPMGSANRMLLSSRSGTLGTDFVPTWCVFVFFLYRLIPRFRPDLNRLLPFILILFFATLIGHFAVVRQMAAAANATVLTDEMVRRTYLLAQVTWALLFLNTVLCSMVLLETQRVLKVGGEILFLSAGIGLWAVGEGYDLLIGPAAVALFVGLCGVSLLFVLNPALLEMPEARRKPAAAQPQV
jgi:hypothetical protein